MWLIFGIESNCVKIFLPAAAILDVSSYYMSIQLVYLPGMSLVIFLSLISMPPLFLPAEGTMDIVDLQSLKVLQADSKELKPQV